MSMHNLPHPGEIIKAFRVEPLNLTVTKAAESLGVTRKIFSMLLNEARAYYERLEKKNRLSCCMKAIKCCILLFHTVWSCEISRQEVFTVTSAVRVSEELVREARIFSKIDQRSLTGQIEHWAKIGKCAEENPDLTYNLIRDILIGLFELEQGESSEYKFG